MPIILFIDNMIETESQSTNDIEKKRYYLLTHQKVRSDRSISLLNFVVQAISARTFEEESAFKDVINLAEGKNSVILHNHHPRDVTSLLDLILTELGAKYTEIGVDIQYDIKNNVLVVNEGI